MRIWLMTVFAALSAAAWPQARERVAITAPEPITMEAHVAEYRPPAWYAEGDVLFQQGQKRFLADRATYDPVTSTGLLTHVAFTTCDLARPDYRITAREIRLTSDQRLSARRVRIYLGNLRLISLPGLSIDVRPGAYREALLPRPGYSSRDGFFVATNYPLVNTDSAAADLRVRLTSRRGMQTGLSGGYAFRGSARVTPPYVPDFDSELRQIGILLPLVQGQVCAFPESRQIPRLVAGFAALVIRERAFDLRVPDLLVTRLPEVGVRYVSPDRCILRNNGQPALGLQVQSHIGWGRFRETPGRGYVDRWDARSTVSTTLATFGRSTALRGAALARYSSYTAGGSYRVLGASLDLSRIFPGGSFASARLIGHAISGSTPLEFDDIDIPHELQGAGRYVRGRNTFEIVLDYDLDNHSLRDWQFAYARRLHCLEPSITWRNRFRQISIGVRVLGL